MSCCTEHISIIMDEETTVSTGSAEGPLQNEYAEPIDASISVSEDKDDGPEETGDTTTPTVHKDEKVKIHFIAAGNAPIMKRNKFLVARTETFASLQTRLRKLIQQPQPKSQLNLITTLSSSPSPALFMYLHTCFVPSLEDTIGQLFDLYHTSQELKVHYSLQEAWG